MKNPLKSRHLLFRVHRVYGIQNDRLDLTVNEFLTVLKTLHCSQRNLQTNKEINERIANISGYGALFSKPLKTRYS